MIHNQEHSPSIETNPDDETGRQRWGGRGEAMECSARSRM